MEYINALKLMLNGRDPVNRSFHSDHCKVFKEENMKWESLSAIIAIASVMWGEWNYMH